MHETILLVDDEPLIRRLMSNALSGAGYRVIEARTGAEALRAFDEQGAEVDMLITDMRLPGLAGSDLIASLRQKRRTLKVLCITGYPLNVPDDMNEPTLYKPFSREQLLQTVRDTLGGDPNG